MALALTLPRLVFRRSLARFLTLPKLIDYNWVLSEAEYTDLEVCQGHYSDLLQNVNVPLDGRIVDRIRTEILADDLLNSYIARVFRALYLLQECLEERNAAVETAAADPELRELALDDVASLERTLIARDAELAEALAEVRGPLRFLDVGVQSIESIRLVIEAGVGGTEAALFARDLFGMYELWLRGKGWTFEVAGAGSKSDAEVSTDGAFVATVVSRPGEDAYALLEGECGVHRVQRVPSTDRQGRIHTSAAAVRIAPIVDPQRLVSGRLFREEDITISYLRAGTAGGQRTMHVESGCRLHHIPSKTSIEVQAGRSKIDNERTARAELAAMLISAKMLALKQRLSAMRGRQVTGTDRSDKIRTYSFENGRVTDHRTNVVAALDDVLGGDLDPFAEAYEEMESENAVSEGLGGLLGLFKLPSALNMPSRTLTIRGADHLRTLVGPPI